MVMALGLLLFSSTPAGKPAPDRKVCPNKLMNSQIGLETCLRFVSSEGVSSGTHIKFSDGEPPPLAITISRQAGSGAQEVAKWLAAHLQTRAPNSSRPWSVFDANLPEKVLEEHKLPRRLARFMPEDRVSEMGDAMEELLGAHPPSWTLVNQTAETILHLAEQGNVILIGRGANIITSKLKHVFHVRLVGSIEKRVEHLRVNLGVSRKAALELIRKQDRGRERYLKRYFDKDVHDPLLYHLIINTDLVTYENTALMIGEAALTRLYSLTVRANKGG